MNNQFNRNHDLEYVNKYDNKFEPKYINKFDKFEDRKIQGFGGMTNPTYGTPYQPFEEQHQQQLPMPMPPMMKKGVNFTGPYPYETYGPMQKETITYGPMPYPQDMPYGPQYPQYGPQPQFAPGWSKDFVKQCTLPMHVQHGCPPNMPYDCTFEPMMTKDIKWPVPVPTPVQVPVPTPVQVPVPMPVPTPIHTQWPQQPMLPMLPQGQWNTQYPTQYPIQWQNQWQYDLPYPTQWTKDIKYHDMPYLNQWSKDFKYPIGQPMYEQPMHYGPTIDRPYGPTGVRHTQLTTTRW